MFTVEPPLSRSDDINPATARTFRPPLKAATNFSSVGEKPPSDGTMRFGRRQFRRRGDRPLHVRCHPASSCGTSTAAALDHVGAAGMEAAAGRAD